MLALAIIGLMGGCFLMAYGEDHGATDGRVVGWTCIFCGAVLFSVGAFSALRLCGYLVHAQLRQRIARRLD